MAHQGRTMGPSNYSFGERPRGGWGSDYQKTDDSAQTIYRFRCYALNELVIETAMSHGLRVERVSYPNDAFVIVKVWATKQDFRAAQYEWLQKMIATQQRQTVLSTIRNEMNLFA